MAGIASLVPKARPTLISALFLAVAVLALEDGSSRHACGSQGTVASLHSTLLRAPQTLDWSAPPPNMFDPWDTPSRPVPPVIRPPALFPDAQPWPRGMVIAPPALDEAIVLLERSPLDNLLSAFFTVLRTLES